MGNSFVTVKNIARQALPRLIENLVFPNLIHRDYSADFVPGLGATIQVKKPVVLTAQEFDASNGTSPQDVNEGSIDVTLDKLADVSVEFGAIESATNVDDLNRLFVEPAAVALAEKINSDGLGLYKDVAQAVGTAGTTPSTLAAFADAAKVLNEAKVPTTERFGVWNPAANAAFQQLPALVNAEKSGTTEALRAGSIGRVFGIENFMAQGIKTHEGGALVGDGITVNANVSNASEVVIKATSLTGTVKAGDILVINGKNYAVTADATAASNKVTCKVSPAITASAGDTVTVIAGGAQNLVFHKNAFAFVTRPLTAPAGVESYVTAYNGITLRVVRGYDMRYKKDMLSMDVLYGYKTIYPELACRVLG